MPATDKMLFDLDRPSVGIGERRAFTNALALALSIILWLTYFAIYLPFLPTPQNTIGHDYGIHLPDFLTGHCRYLQNGPWRTPWFSPSQCGGFPFLADPDVICYSATPLFVIATSPIHAVLLTFLVFSFIGAAGTFYTVRRAWHACFLLTFLMHPRLKRRVASRKS
ncbi:hypothetical protein [Bradyrhizobium sp. LHD-71]|uniref:hypothetical protein n=1 Tax=Bradyrhizobium sp. LHD-71 TaxID=3072141 RepID=UPI00280E338D|nr:hypothetical protein [Bradyrhizobium sp. LHD-71]MDQ8726208.1 hypothetical protein [Bradyrhizobium sp. LHD-71]